MPEPKKTRRCWAYVTEDDDARLTAFVKKLGAHYNDTLAISIIAEAGLRALEREGYRVTLPLEFEISKQERYQLNEPAPHKRK